MEPVQAKDIPTERQIFADAWQLLTQYYHLTENDDSGWDEAITRANDICGKIEGNPAAFNLSKAVVIAVLKYLETKQGTGSDQQGGNS